MLIYSMQDIQHLFARLNMFIGADWCLHMHLLSGVTVRNVGTFSVQPGQEVHYNSGRARRTRAPLPLSWPGNPGTGGSRPLDSHWTAGEALVAPEGSPWWHIRRQILDDEPCSVQEKGKCGLQEFTDMVFRLIARQQTCVSGTE